MQNAEINVPAATVAQKNNLIDRLDVGVSATSIVVSEERPLVRSGEPGNWGRILRGLVNVYFNFPLQENRVIGCEKSESAFTEECLGSLVPLINKEADRFGALQQFLCELRHAIDSQSRSAQLLVCPNTFKINYLLRVRDNVGFEE